MTFLKKTASAALFFLFVIAALEAISFAAYFARNGSAFSYAEARAQLRQAAESGKELTAQEVLQGKIKVLHPYLGYVYDASKRDFLHAGISISDYGFPDDHDLVQQRSGDKLIVGILGGSVAWWFQSLGYEAFAAELKRVPALRDKKIVLVRMALGGFKQPQQLMAYTYALALGGEFDLLINIDGYNEVSLYPFGSSVNPVFPHEWELLAGDRIDPDTVKRIGIVESLQQQRTDVADSFMGSVLRYSVSANLGWQLLDAYLVQGISRARRELADAEEKKATGLPYAVRGPAFPSSSAEEFYGRLAKVWADSSRALHDLSTARGTKYIHILQPNQYVPNSKRSFSSRELKQAYTPAEAWALLPAAGYPSLIEAGKSLVRAGVDYHDLTMIFLDEQGSMYEDSCCHLSVAGNEIFGQKVGEIVARRFLSGH